jgi:HD-GYP domain-containing protein (c-di-GMP phosphodiesterase class II)
MIAILGALAADEFIWSFPLLFVPTAIAYIAFKSVKEAGNETLRLLEDMADTVDLRDIYTGGHSRRVAELVHQILDQLNIFGHEASIIEIAARLHDIGKIGISDEILKKPAKLSAEEMGIMQTHSETGANLIAKYKDFSRGALMIRHHHESWNGNGYPGNLRDYNIPFGSRVIAVADSFDAMTSDRPYRKAMSKEIAIQILLEGRGKQWDPSVVNAFLTAINLQSDPPQEDSLSEADLTSALYNSISNPTFT